MLCLNCGNGLILSLICHYQIWLVSISQTYLLSLNLVHNVQNSSFFLFHKYQINRYVMDVKFDGVPCNAKFIGFLCPKKLHVL